MEAVLLVVHLIIALGIIIVVLIQPSEAGGFLGSNGSMSNMLAPRRSGDGLTRLTGILAALFFTTSLLLAIVAGSRPAPTSIMDEMEAVTPALQNTTPAEAQEEGAAPADADAQDATAPAPEAEPEAPTAPIAK